MRPLRDLVSDRGAHIGIMTAVTAPFAIALAAVAIDAGSLHLERRTTQTITDLAAIAAAASPGEAAQAALATFADNGFGDVHLLAASTGASPPPVDAGAVADLPEDRILVEAGRYSGDPTLSVSERFVIGATPPNAVRVEFSTRGQLYFGTGIMARPVIRTTAVARMQAAASFSIGSRLARLDGGIVNQLLGGLLGSNLSLSLMDYEALAAADVNLLSFLTALDTQAGLRAATYDDVLAADVRMGQVARALQESLPAGSEARTAAGRLTASDTLGTFNLSGIVDAGHLGLQAPGTLDAGLAANVGALALLANSAALANGDRQVAVDLGNRVAGLLDVALVLAIGERPQASPWIAIGSSGEIVRTAQTRLRLSIEIGGLGGLLPSVIKVPLYLDVAQAEARLADIRCPGGPQTVTVDVDARPGIAHLRLGEVTPAALRNFAAPPPNDPARLIQVPLLVSVTAFAAAEIAETSYSTLSFSQADIAARTIRRVATTEIAGSLAGSLLGSADVRVNVLGLGLGLPGGLKGLVQSALVRAAPAVDAALGTILSTLGLSLGEADVRVHGATCGRAVLVQ